MKASPIFYVCTERKDFYENKDFYKEIVLS